MEHINAPHKLLIYLDDRPKIGFFFWFCMGIFILFFFRPFQQPLMFDRAFLVYMSQVVSRGDFLYDSTPFGYTPLSTIVVGYLMRAGQAFSLNTIEVARITGIVCYGLCSGSIFLMCRALFKDQISPFIGAFLFCGIAFIPMIAGVNAEPKIWVLLGSVLGIYACIKGKWGWSGLWFSIAAMSWHVAVISVLATGLTILLTAKQYRWIGFFRFSFGVFMGTVPVLLYLWATDGWIGFWDQAVVRKLVVEGKNLGDDPLFWMLEGSATLLTDVLHMVGGFLGFVWLLYIRFVRRESADPIRSRTIQDYLIIYTVLWAIFNTLEYQGAPDLIPLIPVLVVYVTLLLVRFRPRRRIYAYVFGGLLVLYNWFDALTYSLPYTYQDQVATVQAVEKQYGSPFVIGHEAHYTVLERPMPTKFMRYWAYEDFLISREEGGCEAIKQQLLQGDYQYIVEYDVNRRVRSEESLAIRNWLGLASESKKKNKSKKQKKKRKKQRQQRKEGRGRCAHELITSLTTEEEVGHFIIPIQSLPIGGNFYTDEYFSVLRIDSDLK